jgi:hypothetical protein
MNRLYALGKSNARRSADASQRAVISVRGGPSDLDKSRALSPSKPTTSAMAGVMDPVTVDP